MKVLKVCPGKRPYCIEIESGLSSLQQQVGGFIETVYPFEEPVAVICNEEGKINGLPFNRSLKDEGETYTTSSAAIFLLQGLMKILSVP